MRTKKDLSPSTPGFHVPFKWREKRCQVLLRWASTTSDAGANCPVLARRMVGWQYHMSNGVIGYCGGIRIIRSVSAGAKPPPETPNFLTTRYAPPLSLAKFQSYPRSLRKRT